MSYVIEMSSIEELRHSICCEKKSVTERLRSLICHTKSYAIHFWILIIIANKIQLPNFFYFFFHNNTVWGYRKYWGGDCFRMSLFYQPMSMQGRSCKAESLLSLLVREDTLCSDYMTNYNIFPGIKQKKKNQRPLPHILHT